MIIFPRGLTASKYALGPPPRMQAKETHAKSGGAPTSLHAGRSEGLWSYNRLVQSAEAKATEMAGPPVLNGLSDSLATRYSAFSCFRQIFGQTWPQNPSRTTGLVLQCRLNQKSAPQTNSNTISWQSAEAKATEMAGWVPEGSLAGI